MAAFIIRKWKFTLGVLCRVNHYFNKHYLKATTGVTLAVVVEVVAI